MIAWIHSFFAKTFERGVLILLGVGVLVGIFTGIRYGFLRPVQHPTFDTSSAKTEQVAQSMTVAGRTHDTAYLFDANQVEDVAIGSLIADLGTSISPWWFDVFVTTEGGVLSERYVVYGDGGERLFEIKPACTTEKVCRVGEVTVYSGEFRTREGIGPGSSYAELQALYGVETVEYSNAGFYVGAADMTFVIPGEYGLRYNEGEVVPYDTIPDKAIIQHIVVK